METERAIDSSALCGSANFDEQKKERIKYFAETASSHLLANESRVLLWAKARDNYITTNKKVVLRVRDASNFGFKTRFSTRIRGELFLIDWRTALLRFQPNVLEIYGSGNPLPYLLYSLEAAGIKDTVIDVFKHINELALIKTDVLFQDVEELLTNMDVLAGLSLNQICFSAEDFKLLTQHLIRLNLRAISLTGGLSSAFLDELFSFLQLEVISFSTESMVRLSDLTGCSASSSATRLLYLQEVSFDLNPDKTDEGPQQLLAIVPRLFPYLETLIWDWTMVEPFDAQSEVIIASLIALYKELRLKALVIPLYTPYKEVLEDVQNICEIFEKHDLPHQNRRFCSSGVGKPNFTLLCIGEDDDSVEDGLMARIRELFIKNKCTRFDELCPLLYVVTGEERYKYVDESSTLSLDFGGFDVSRIREKCLA